MHYHDLVFKKVNISLLRKIIPFLLFFCEFCTKFFWTYSPIHSQLLLRQLFLPPFPSLSTFFPQKYAWNLPELKVGQKGYNFQLNNIVISQYYVTQVCGVFNNDVLNQVLESRCVIYFSIAMIKCHDTGNL